jgi:predicted RNA-binding Zn-ribbon protein involved in translation (DUF1610 family)
MEVLWGIGLLLASLAVVTLAALMTRPPRCRACQVLATSVDEYELSSTPRVIAVAFRCPRCGELVQRPLIGVPEL